MTWQPQQQGLRELLVLLRDAADPTNREQALMTQRLASFHEYPDYNAYLAYILIQLKSQEISTRMMAGDQLKLNLTNQFNRIPIRVLDYLKQTCLDYIQSPPLDDNERILNTISCVISIIFSRGRVHNWSNGLMLLIEKLKDPVVFKFSLNTIFIMCSEVSKELDQEIQVGIQPPLGFILPYIIQAYSSTDSTVRAQAIHATRQFVLLKQASFLNQLDILLPALYQTSKDPVLRVRHEFGKILPILLEAFPERVEPYLDLTIEFMIQALKDTDNDIVLAACDFWIDYAHSEVYRDQLIPYLPQLVPTLLHRMVYSESDLLDLLPFIPHQNDRLPPLPPPSKCYSRPKPDHIKHSNDLINHLQEEEEEAVDSDFDDTSCSSSSMKHDDDEEEEEDDDDDDDDNEDGVDEAEFYARDSSRQSSASALDILAVTFRDDFCTILLDLLFNQTLNDENWLIRESGILALGAAAEGGIDVFSLHLDRLIPYLLKSMIDPEPLVRSISCWAISRFSNWLVDEHKATRFFEPVLFGLLNRLLDSNKRVQESACTGFIVLTESASIKLVPYLYQILFQTNRAFGLYKRKNRLFLYDALGTLADAVKSELNQPQFINLLMPPLITKWNELSDKDTDLFPLLECLSNITAALGPGFIQYVDPVLTRCVKLISSTLQEQMMADQNPETVVPPNVEFLIAALDLLSGIVQGLGATIEPLIAKTNPPLLSLLVNCIHDPVPEVLQSTFVLLGDIAGASFDSLLPYFHTILTEMIRILCNQGYFISFSVYNNVIWALGEMVMRCQSTQVQGYLSSLLQVLVPLFTHSTVPASIHENVMIALGRLSLICPDLLAPTLSLFIQPCLKTSLSVREGEEKESAFRGLCAIIKLNAQDAHQHLHLLLVAISTWEKPSDRLLVDLCDVVKGYYRILTRDQWNNAFNTLNSDEKSKILKFLTL